MKYILRLTIFIIIVLLPTVFIYADNSFSHEPVVIEGWHSVPDNPDLKTGRHTFVLTAINEAPMPNDAVNGIKKITVTTGEKFSFGKIFYPHQGIYEYSVSRELQNIKTLNEDGSVYSVKVTVFADGTHALTIAKTDGSGKKDKIEYIDSSNFKISFDPNKGVFNNGSSDVLVIYAKKGEVITIAEAPTKKSAKFQYWKGSKYYPGQQYTVMGDHEFTAIYKETLASRINDAVKTGDSKNLILYGTTFILALISLGLFKRKES